MKDKFWTLVPSLPFTVAVRFAPDCIGVTCTVTGTGADVVVNIAEVEDRSHAGEQLRLTIFPVVPPYPSTDSRLKFAGIGWPALKAPRFIFAVTSAKVVLGTIVTATAAVCVSKPSAVCASMLTG